MKKPEELVKVIEPEGEPFLLDLSTPKKAEESKKRLFDEGRCYIEPGRTCLLPNLIRKTNDFSNHCRACVDRTNTIQIIQMQTAAMGGMAKLTGALAQSVSKHVSEE